MIEETSAGMVMYRNVRGRTEFLLLHYPSGHWDFVKGKMEGAETPKETALREAREETGISDVRFVDGFEERIRYEFVHAGELIRKTVVLYLAETRAKDVTISHEHLGYCWKEYGEAVEKTTFENARAVLSRAKDRLEQ